MMKSLLCAALVLAAAPFAPGQAPMHMSFANTSAATVLKVIAARTSTNIVFVGKDTATISLDVTVYTAEDAIRAAVSAAGLSYRKVNRAYIVAPQESMRHALEPYSSKVQYQMPPGVADKILKTVQDSYPDATVQVAGDKLVFSGVADDVKESQSMVRELELRVEQDSPVTEVVPMHHSNPADAAKALGGLYPDLKVASAGDEKGGALTISGPKRLVDPAMDFARRIDETVANAPQNEFRVYEIKYISASKLEEFMKKAAPDVQAYIAPENYSPKRALFNPLTSQISSAAGGSSSTGGGGTGGGTGGGGTSGQAGQTGTTGTQGGAGNQQEEPNARVKRLVLCGPPNRLDAAIRLLESVDIKSQQIFVEVKVVETSPSFEDNIGFTWSWSPLGFTETPPSTVALNHPFGQYSRAPFNFTSILNAKITKGEAKLLANPKVGVLDNDGASIFIGDTINALITQSGLTGPSNQIASFQVGIILLIHPRINVDGNITMHVNPVISTVTGITNGLPQTSSREAETTMIVKDGDTIVLGGLIQDNFTKTVTEVPFLSKLPILGELFRNRSTKHDKTDVIITITVHIMKDTPGK